MRVRVLGQMGADHLGALRALCPDVAFDEQPTEAAPSAALIWEQRQPEVAALLAGAADTLAWVHFRRVGLQPRLLELFDAHPRIQLTNGSGAAGIAVAEHVLAVLLALCKRLPELQRRQQAQEWVRSFEVDELNGRTACIVGLGDLGRSVARVLRPFGVRLLGTRRHAEPVAEVDETHPPEALGDLLARSSIVILAAPLTPDTEHLLGPAELARLPRGSWVINVGRGALVDEAALTAALVSGQIGGAGLDVFEREPLAPESPLWTLPNVIVTPHAAAHTLASDERSVELFAANLARFREGGPLASRLDRGRGY